MNSITYFTIAYKRNYVLQKLSLNKAWWKNSNRGKWGFDSFGIEIQNKSTVFISAVATVARGGRAFLLNDCLCPLPISVYSESVFGTSRYGNTTGNNGTRDNKVQT